VARLMSERLIRIGEAETEAARAKAAAKVVEKRIAIVWKGSKSKKHWLSLTMNEGKAEKKDGGYRANEG